VYIREAGEVTEKSELNKSRVHVPLYLLPDSLRPVKPVIASWDPYSAGDKSTKILQNFQQV